MYSQSITPVLLLTIVLMLSSIVMYLFSNFLSIQERKIFTTTFDVPLIVEKVSYEGGRLYIFIRNLSNNTSHPTSIVVKVDGSTYVLETNSVPPGGTEILTLDLNTPPSEVTVTSGAYVYRKKLETGTTPLTVQINEVRYTHGLYFAPPEENRYDSILFFGDSNRVIIEFNIYSSLTTTATISVSSPDGCVGSVTKTVSLSPGNNIITLETNTLSSGACTIEYAIDTGSIIETNSFSTAVNVLTFCGGCDDEVDSCTSAILSAADDTNNNYLIVLSRNDSYNLKCMNVVPATYKYAPHITLDGNGHVLTSTGDNVMVFENITGLVIRNVELNGSGSYTRTDTSAAVLAPDDGIYPPVTFKYASASGKIAAYYNGRVEMYYSSFGYSAETWSSPFAETIMLSQPCISSESNVYLRMYVCSWNTNVGFVRASWQINSGTTTLSSGTKDLGYILNDPNGCVLVDLPEANFTAIPPIDLEITVTLSDLNSGTVTTNVAYIKDMGGGIFMYIDKMFPTASNCQPGAFTYSSSVSPPYYYMFIRESAGVEKCNYGFYICKSCRYVDWNDYATFTNYDVMPKIYILASNNALFDTPHRAPLPREIIYLYIQTGGRGSTVESGEVNIEPLPLSNPLFQFFTADTWASNYQIGFEANALCEG